MVLANCQHKVPPPGPIQFFKGKAQIFDKQKNKTDYVNFEASVEYPLRLRLDVSMVTIGLPLAVLAIDNEKATMLSLNDRKAYQTEQSSLLLERLLKAQISAYDITGAFAERFPLSRAWSCKKEGDINQCKTSGLSLEHTTAPEQSRQMVIDSERSKVTLIYQPTSSGSTQFNVKVPKEFKSVEL